jgi:endonuclease/exonuclease/phosphatase family metal-dependent hydrolase
VKIKQILWYLVCVLIALGLVGGIFGSGRHVAFDFLSLFPQWFYILPFTLLVVSTFGVFGSGRARLQALLLCGLILSGVIYQIDVVWLKNENTDLSVRYKVLSWNMAYLEPHENVRLFELVEKYTADFYVFQEAEYKRNKNMYAEFVYRFPELYAGHYGEYFTVSKYPMSCDTPDRSGGYLKCETEAPTGKLGLINVHLKRPFHVSNFRSYEDFAIRRTQFMALRKSIAESSGPMIVAGDFNSPANYAFVRQLQNDFVMNNPTGMLVLPHTFSANRPYIRIDYQFARGGLEFCGYEALSYPDISDHIGILGSICTLE